MDVKPTTLDGGHQIILANWPSYRKIMCMSNNNIPINICSHPYMLMNRSILYNCDVEAESNFLLESLAASENLKTKGNLVMYFTVNLAWKCNRKFRLFYFKNWTTQMQILPISVESFEFDSKLLSAPKTIKDFVTQYKCRKEMMEKKEQKKVALSLVLSLIASW